MFYDQVLRRHESADIQGWAASKGSTDVMRAIEKAESERPLTEDDLISLLSNVADEHLEKMAQVSRKLTLRHFGKVVVLYRPIYISNYCSNRCLYCGFNHENTIKRRHLTLDEIENEARHMERKGVKQILLLTGETPNLAPVEYIGDAVELLSRTFDSVSLEVYPMDEGDYRYLKGRGADGLTVYQETYNREIYQEVHPAGPKRDYLYRLETPERGARAGLRSLGIGPLYGLGELKKEAFAAALHARYLMNTYLDTEVSLSLPRINPAPGGYQPKEELEDRSFVRFFLAFRLFLPQVGLNISTRESASFRDNLVGMGVTKLSAESKTSVGGYSEEAPSDVQFETEDNRTVEQVMEAVKMRGFQPVLKDWVAFG